MFSAKTLFSLSLLFSGDIFSLQSFAEIQDRCTEQNLNPADARLRNRWAFRCFPQQHSSIKYFQAKKPIHYALVQHENGSWEGPIDPAASCAGWKIKAF